MVIIKNNKDCCVVFCFVFPVLPASLDCPFLIAPPVFSKVYCLTTTDWQPSAIPDPNSHMLVSADGQPHKCPTRLQLADSINPLKDQMCILGSTNISSSIPTGSPREIVQGGRRLLWGPGERLWFLSKLRIWGPITTLVNFHKCFIS
jgi:hypothetical protein